jgi:diguanylate cyclase (GGDEF)-like protein
LPFERIANAGPAANRETMTQTNTAPASILIIDDDEQIQSLLKDVLSPNGDCTTVSSAEEALAILKSIDFNVVISDINMGAISGLDLVPQVLARSPDTVVVMISGQQTIDFAIDAMRAGAFDYITKPLDLRHVDTAVRRALSHHDLLKQKRRYENHLEDLVKERTAEVEHLAYHDGLTGLPNRVLFEDRCTQALAIAQRRQNLVAVMLVSIDRCKKVTESLGHAAGDVVLTEAAARLQSCITNRDTVARFDGDEFALLLTNVAETGDLAEVAHTINEAGRKQLPILCRRHECDGHKAAGA